MAPKGGQEALQRAQAEQAFDQVSLSNASFSADRDPGKAGIQLAEPVEVEGVRAFHRELSLAQRYMTGRDDAILTGDVSRGAKNMVQEIFQPIADAKNAYVAQALEARGLGGKGPDFDGAIASIKGLKESYAEKFAIAA